MVAPGRVAGQAPRTNARSRRRAAVRPRDERRATGADCGGRGRGGRAGRARGRAPQPAGAPPLDARPRLGSRRQAPLELTVDDAAGSCAPRTAPSRAVRSAPPRRRRRSRTGPGGARPVGGASARARAAGSRRRPPAPRRPRRRTRRPRGVFAVPTIKRDAAPREATRHVGQPLHHEPVVPEIGAREGRNQHEAGRPPACRARCRRRWLRRARRCPRRAARAASSRGRQRLPGPARRRGGSCPRVDQRRGRGRPWVHPRRNHPIGGPSRAPAPVGGCAAASTWIRRAHAPATSQGPPRAGGE